MRGGWTGGWSGGVLKSLVPVVVLVVKPELRILVASKNKRFGASEHV